MIYKIYKMVTPEHLQGSEADGYYRRNITRYVLEEPENYDLRHDFNSMEEALEMIKNYGGYYVGYTIQPYIRNH